jgi:uncharacterized protein (TIGR03089 family)
VSALIADRLRRRVGTAGADPLITYYEPVADVRVELSAVSFANWVDKTCNLVTDEYLLDPGDVVELALSGTHPGHWMTAVWQVASWQLGLTVSVGSGLSPRLVVTGPAWGSEHGSGVDVVACSLHPLGMGFGAALPSGVADYALEVRGQPDSFVPTPQSGLALAWADAQRQLTQADLLGKSQAARRLVRVSEAWPTCRDGVVTALASEGSVVLVAGGTEEQIRKIAADEKAEVSLA